MLNNQTIGIFYSVMAFFLWGVLPLYWKLLDKVPAGEILAHRIVWSFVFCVLILRIFGRLNNMKEVLKPSNWLGLLLSSILISLNWFTYIWAVNHNQIVEVSLGYYISPLLSIFLGMVILREKLNFWQAMALLLAIIGVAVLTMQYGQIPIVAIGVALSFTLYGLTKKLVKVDSLTGLTLETLFVVPIALVFIFFKGVSGTSSFVFSPPHVPFLLIFAGVVTATPLLLFAQGAKRISLTTIGFLQYLGPTISLGLGVFIFGEAFTKIHALAFSFIGLALVLYTFSQSNLLQKWQPKYFKTIAATDGK